MLLGVFGQYILSSSKRHSRWHNMVSFYTIVCFPIVLMVFVTLILFSLFRDVVQSKLENLGQVISSLFGELLKYRQSTAHTLRLTILWSLCWSQGQNIFFPWIVNWTLVFGQSDAWWPWEYVASFNQPAAAKQPCKAENPRLLHEALQQPGRLWKSSPVQKPKALNEGCTMR